MNDMIVIFNRLIESELSDCDLFEEVLENHFDHYRYFYWKICKVSFNKVQKIECSPKENGLEITIIFKSNKHRDEFKDAMENKMTTSSDDKNFSLSIGTKSNRLNISIYDITQI